MASLKLYMCKLLYNAVVQFGIQNGRVIFEALYCSDNTLKLILRVMRKLLMWLHIYTTIYILNYLEEEM